VAELGVNYRLARWSRQGKAAPVVLTWPVATARQTQTIRATLAAAWLPHWRIRHPLQCLKRW